MVRHTVITGLSLFRLVCFFFSAAAQCQQRRSFSKRRSFEYSGCRPNSSPSGFTGNRLEATELPCAQPSLRFRVTLLTIPCGIRLTTSCESRKRRQSTPIIAHPPSHVVSASHESRMRSLGSPPRKPLPGLQRADGCSEVLRSSSKRHPDCNC